MTKQQTETATGDKNGHARPMERADESEFVAQCRERARELSERKADQEQRLGALIEGSFGQLEHIFNALLQAAQDSQAATQAQFAEAATMLDENLARHEQVETKLRAIMAILTGNSSQQ